MNNKYLDKNSKLDFNKIKKEFKIEVQNSEPNHSYFKQQFFSSCKEVFLNKKNHKELLEITNNINNIENKKIYIDLISYLLAVDLDDFALKMLKKYKKENTQEYKNNFYDLILLFRHSLIFKKEKILSFLLKDGFNKEIIDFINGKKYYDVNDNQYEKSLRNCINENTINYILSIYYDNKKEKELILLINALINNGFDKLMSLKIVLEKDHLLSELKNNFDNVNKTKIKNKI